MILPVFLGLAADTYQEYLPWAEEMHEKAQGILKKEGFLDKSSQETLGRRDEDLLRSFILKKDFEKEKESYASYETLESYKESNNRGCQQGILRNEDEGHPLNSTLPSSCHEQKTNGKCLVKMRDQHFPSQNLLPSKDQILVFVSFSMPEASIKALLTDSQDKNVVLVLRGLVEDSFVKTAQKLKELDPGDLKSGLEINPELFDEYAIKAVPTFVKIKDERVVARLRGNVSLSYALDAFKKVASS